MSDITLASMFGKLDEIGYKAAESATVLCKTRGNPHVEIVHWLQQVLHADRTDLHSILRHFEVDPSRLAADVVRALDRLPRGASSITGFSDHLELAIREAWVFASLLFGSPVVRTGHVLFACLKVRTLRPVMLSISKEFERIKVERLSDEFATATSGSDEAHSESAARAAGGAAPGEASGAMAPASMGKQEALAKFTVDLTASARRGEIDNMVGRDAEIRQIVDILMRRRQNNPILVGEAGVGKTAAVEGFARRIAAGDVPPMLEDVRLLTLDMGLLQAGASMKGEFEERLRQVVEEVQSSEKPIILFIDEAHTLIGAGGAAGSGDAANLLKPALARGTLRTIAATTWAEYKKYIEKDPALTRRFQTVKIDEPSEEKAILMMRGMASAMEAHHRVQILDEALEAAVRLSHRYIPSRQLPDKSVSLLDTAAARVAVSQHAVPASVEDSRRRIEALENELEIIAREAAYGVPTEDRRASAEAALAEERTRLEGLEAKWADEREIVSRILELRGRLRAGAEPVEGTGSDLEAAAAEARDREAEAAEAGGDDSAEIEVLVREIPEEEREQLLAELIALQSKLESVQGEDPLMLPSVDEQAVASVVGDWTGIPVGRMVRNEIETVLNLEKVLAERVLGQDHALEMICHRVRTNRAGLDNPSKPVGVFMLAGPSGVGKTETALALAESLYGGEQNLITINMSEFQEAHTVSTLKGAPPGYVGYGEGGVLTEAVRRKPYSVVLLDEVEKAHSDVHEIFFQVFDKGVMEDGEGRVIDFKNTLILLTSNVGSELIMSLCADPDLMPAPEDMAKELRTPLLEQFPAALLGRIVTIPYKPLDEAMVRAITELQLGRVKRRVEDSHDVPFTYDPEVVDQIVARCSELESGGRMIDAILTNTVLPAVSVAFLERMAAGEPIRRVHVTVEDGEFSYEFDGGDEGDVPSGAEIAEPAAAG